MVSMIGILSLLMVQQGGGMMVLPEPAFEDVYLEQCIEKRRSVRIYENKALSLEEMSNLLWAAQGTTDEERGLRAAPSAGATYPLEIFIATGNGVFRYVPQSHALRKTSDNDIRLQLAAAALDQDFIAEAGMVVVITAVFRRTTLRYGERGVRYVHIEVGHCAQNIHLAAVAMDLGSVPIGAFDDDRIADLLKLDQEEPLYMIPVGHLKSTR